MYNVAYICIVQSYKLYCFRNKELLKKKEKRKKKELLCEMDCNFQECRKTICSGIK